MKSLAKNSIYNIIYRIFNILFPLISEAYIARILLPEGVGKVALALTIATYFITIAALGIPNYGIKVIGGVQLSRESRSKIFSELFVLNFISTIICTLTYMVFVNVFREIADVQILNIFNILVIANILNIDWLYQGIEEYGYITVRNLFIKLLSLVLLIAFVKNQEDCKVYALILCFATCGNYLFNIIKAHKYVDFIVKGIEIKRHIKPVMLLFFSICATEVYTMLDSTMVGIIRSDTELGYYTNATRLARTIFNILTAMCAVFLPRLSLFYKKKDYTEYNKLANFGAKIALLFSIPGTIGVFILAEPIILILYGNAFRPSVVALKILCILILVFSVAYTCGHIVLISSNNESDIMKATVCGAIVNFLLNIVLISKLGYIGAAISSVIAETMVTMMLVVNSRKVADWNINFKFIFSILASTILMTFVLIGIKSIIKSKLIVICVGVITSLLVYLVGLSVTKNEMLVHFKHLVSKKVKENNK